MNIIFTKLKLVINCFSKRITLLILALILIIPSVIVGAGSSNLTGNGTIVRPKASEVANMTIIIGTHMIALNALTQELKDIAEKTIEGSGQNNIYYKSELVDENRDGQGNKGAWFEISNAQEIDDILSKGEVVADEVIDNLTLTHFTDENNRTWDLLTGKEVNIFDIEDVYDISNMEELKSLKLEYDAKKDSKPKDEKDEEKAKSLEEVKKSLQSIFEMDVKSDETEKIRLTIDNLNKYFNYLVLSGASDEEKEMALNIIGAKYAELKKVIRGIVLEKVDEEISSVSALEDSYGDVKEELTKSISELESKMLPSSKESENLGLIEKYITELTEQYIKYVEENNYDNANELLKNIVELNKMSQSIIGDRERQLELASNLKKRSNEDWDKLIHDNKYIDEYNEAKKSNKSAAILDSIKNKYIDDVKRIIADIEQINDIILKLSLNKSEQAIKQQSTVEELSQQIGELKAEINSSKKKDDLLANSDVDVFKEVAISKLELMLDKEISKLQAINNDLNDNSEILEQENEMATLKNEYKNALDKNDLLKAKEVKEKIDVLQQKIDSRNKQINDRVAELNTQLTEIQEKLNEGNLDEVTRTSLEKQKVDIKSQKTLLGASNTGQNSVDEKIINSCCEDAKTILSKPLKEENIEELNNISSKIKNVAQSNPQIGYPAMLAFSEDIESKINTDSSIPGELLDIANDVGQAVEDLKNAYDTKKSNELNESTIDEKVEVFAKDNDLDDIGKNLLLLGALNNLFSDYGQVDDDTATKDLNSNQKIIKLKMGKLISNFTAKNNAGKKEVEVALIDKKRKNSELYAPADEIAWLTNAKYVWEPNLVKGHLVFKGKIYTFISGKNTVTSSKGEKLKMSNVVIFESDKDKLEATMWLPGSFCEENLNLVVQDLKCSNKAMVYSNQAYEMMEKMYEAIK